MSRAQAEEERVGQDGDRLQDAVQVEQRLAHAHEDDVRQVATGRRQPASGMANLVDDLRGLEVAAEAELAGGAEGAADGAARLAGDAQRVALAMDRPADGLKTPRRIVHQHGLHERPVREQVERLLGQAAVGDGDLVGRDRIHAERVLDAGPESGREGVELVRGLGVHPPDGVPNLTGAVGGLALGGEPGLEDAVGQATQPGAWVGGGTRRGRVGAGRLLTWRGGETHEAAIIACRPRRSRRGLSNEVRMAPEVLLRAHLAAAGPLQSFQHQSAVGGPEERRFR